MVPPGGYVLEVQEAALVKPKRRDWSPQIRLRFSVIEGMYDGSEFDDYMRIGAEPTRIIARSKLYELVKATVTVEEAWRLAVRDSFDPTLDLIGYRLRAWVGTTATGSRNKLIYGSLSPAPLHMEARALVADPNAPNFDTSRWRRLETALAFL